MKEAVVCIIQNQNKETLFLKRNCPPFGWCLPGGKIEKGETKERALRREILEETGVFIFDAKPVKVSKSEAGETVHVFYVKINDDSVILSPEHSAYFWTKENPAFELAGNTAEFVSHINFKKPVPNIAKPEKDITFWFGKHKGLRFVDVARNEPAYILWVRKNTQHAVPDDIFNLALETVNNWKKQRKLTSRLVERPWQSQKRDEDKYGENYLGTFYW